MEFEWDDQKNRANFKKHGIWFEDAQTVWTDARSVEFFDPRHSELEDRFIRVGFSRQHTLLLVIYCERAEGSMTRIISARRATQKESKEYEKTIRPK